MRFPTELKSTLRMDRDARHRTNTSARCLPRSPRALYSGNFQSYLSRKIIIISNQTSAELTLRNEFTTEKRT